MVKGIALAVSKSAQVSGKKYHLPDNVNATLIRGVKLQHAALYQPRPINVPGKRDNGASLASARLIALKSK